MSKNTPIGTCPCPFRNCEQIGELFRFRARSNDTEKQRFAGKLYMVCPGHGMIRDNEWCLQNGTITGGEQPDSTPTVEDPAPAANEVPDETEEGSAAEPSPASDIPADVTSDDEPKPWGFF